MAVGRRFGDQGEFTVTSVLEHVSAATGRTDEYTIFFSYGDEHRAFTVDRRSAFDGMMDDLTLMYAFRQTSQAILHISEVVEG